MEDYKEKYKKVLERAKAVKETYLNLGNISAAIVLESIFPELKESDDERIRKEIITYLDREITLSNFGGDIATFKEWIAWLGKQDPKKHEEELERAYKCADEVQYRKGYEDAKKEFEKQGEHKCDCKYVGCHVNDVKRWCHKKQAEILYEKCNIECSEYLKQDEQKPTDYELTPKALFKKGDWVTNGIDFTFQVISIKDNHYLRSDDYFIDIETADKKFRLWTIQDAKDGDVLVVNGEVFIYAHRKQMYSIAVAHCFVDSAGGFYFDGEFGYTEKGNSIHPATKEQRDTLMEAMADAGYTFDFEKKELKKIEQKSAWSEEDEEMFDDIIADIQFTQKAHTHDDNQVVYEREIDWLKSIKERMKGE